MVASTDPSLPLLPVAIFHPSLEDSLFSQPDTKHPYQDQRCRQAQQGLSLPWRCFLAAPLAAFCSGGREEGGDVVIGVTRPGIEESKEWGRISVVMTNG